MDNKLRKFENISFYSFLWYHIQSPVKSFVNNMWMNILSNKKKKNLSPTYRPTYPQPPNTYTPALFKIASWVGYLPCAALSAIPMKHTTTLQSMTIHVLFSFLRKVLHYTLLPNSLTLLWGLLWTYKHSTLSKREKWAFKIGFKKRSSWKQGLEISTLSRLEQKILTSRPAFQAKSVSSSGGGQTDWVKSPEMPLLFPPI